MTTNSQMLLRPLAQAMLPLEPSACSKNLARVVNMNIIAYQNVGNLDSRSPNLHVQTIERQLGS